MTARLPIIRDNACTISPHPPDVVPALIAAAGERATLRSLEFFAANIRNPHTRRAYAHAVAGFMTWCDANRVGSITAVQPLHVAAWIEQQTREHAAPTAKLRLAALRHLFDWLVTGQVMPTNPAGSVRGPAYAVKAGKTPVLAPEEARALIDRIEITTPVGLRDRALIGVMVFSFARIGAALGMKAEDVFTQNRRLWVRLRGKGGKAHAMPCHHNLETYLLAYIESVGLVEDPKWPLFRTIGRGKLLEILISSLKRIRKIDSDPARCPPHSHAAAGPAAMAEHPDQHGGALSARPGWPARSRPAAARRPGAELRCLVGLDVEHLRFTATTGATSL